MINILRIPDDARIILDGKKSITDASLRFALSNEKLDVYLTAKSDLPQFICLRWNYSTDEPVKVLGDKWERAYADLSWRSMSCEDFMPWYFLVSNGHATTGCGVMVQPNSFVSFQYDAEGVTAWLDVRCGASGVCLDGRELCAASFVCKTYEGISEFEAAKRFCALMSPSPVLPTEPIYGNNSWYRYGKATKTEILENAAILGDLTKENSSRPFMMIDDGWSVNACAGPWVANEEFADMKEIADKMKQMGVKPGIWVRPLHDRLAEHKHPEWLIKNPNGRKYLDPSHPEVKEYLKALFNKISDWGYELLKHDFSTYDLFGAFGSKLSGAALNGMITDYGAWSFYDRSKTSAEIVLDFYRLIRRETRGMIILGCNTVSHLCAGLVEANRTGDDTSSKSWTRTRAMGVNTLAFRLCQNGSFYATDPDCVAMLDGYIPWEMNEQWMKLIANSGVVLFASADLTSASDEMRKKIKEAFKLCCAQSSTAEPLDWLYNNTPRLWKINGEQVKFNWVKSYYTALQYGKIPPHAPDYDILSPDR